MPILSSVQTKNVFIYEIMVLALIGCVFAHFSIYMLNMLLFSFFGRKCFTKQIVKISFGHFKAAFKHRGAFFSDRQDFQCLVQVK